MGRPEPTDSREPAPVNTCNSAPALEEDAPSEEDAAALVARLHQTYGNGLSGVDSICAVHEQTPQLSEIPHWVDDRATAQANLSDYRYDNKADTTGDSRTRGCLGVGPGAGCGYKAARHCVGGTTTCGGTDGTPCDRGSHLGTGHFGGKQTDGTAVATGATSAGGCWNYHRPTGTDWVKRGSGSFSVAHVYGDQTPSPLPSPPAPQMSTKRRGTPRQWQSQLEADHHAATNPFLPQEHHHHADDLPPQCQSRPNWKQQNGDDATCVLPDRGADAVFISSAVSLDGMEPVKHKVEEVAQPMPEMTVGRQPLHQGSIPPSPEDDVSSEKQCEGPVGTMPRRRLQDEDGTGQVLQSPTNCSRQHNSRQRQTNLLSANACARADAGALSPVPMEHTGTSSTEQDDEEKQAENPRRRAQACVGESGSVHQQSRNAATLLRVMQEGAWLGSVVGSEPGESTDSGSKISFRLTTDERLLLLEEEAATTDVDEDEKPAGAAPAASVALAPHECCKSVQNGRHAPTERTEEECEVGARFRCAGATAGGLTVKNIPTQQAKGNGDSGLIMQIPTRVSGAPDEIQQVLQLGEMVSCDRAQYRQCQAADTEGEAADIEVQDLAAVTSPRRIVPAVVATALWSGPTDAAAVGGACVTRPGTVEGGGGEEKGGEAGIGIAGGCHKMTSQHQQRREHDVEEVVFLMRQTNEGGDCTEGDDDESQRQQQQDCAKTWAIDVIQRWLLRSVRRRQGRTGCVMRARLTSDDVATPANGEFDAAGDGVSSAVVALPSMHRQSTAPPARATGELERNKYTLFTGVPRSAVSYQANCGANRASPAPGAEQPSKGAAPACRGSTSSGHPEATSVATTSSASRSGRARFGRWPPQEGPPASRGRVCPYDQEVDDQAQRVSCHPVPTSPKVERAQNSGSPLEVGADGGRDGHAWPREASTATQSGTLLTRAAGSLSVALPFRAAPTPPGHAASLPPEGDEAGGEVQEEKGGRNRGLDQGGNVWVGTSGIRMVGFTERGVSFSDGGPKHPAEVQIQRRTAPPSSCPSTHHCHPLHRRSGQPLDWSSFRNNSMESAASSVGLVSFRDNERGRRGRVRQAGCRSRRIGGVSGGTGIDTGTTPEPERQGVYPNGRRSEGVCRGRGIDATGRASRPEGVCPSQIRDVGATPLGPPVLPPQHQSKAAVSLFLAGGAIGRRRDIAVRTFRNPLLETLDVSNPLLGTAATVDGRGLDDWGYGTPTASRIR